ncbi:MAG: TolC family protein [Myxococcales bacterium]|nr:TolC family protein [Myxococcales bacterium]
MALCFFTARVEAQTPEANLWDEARVIARARRASPTVRSAESALRVAQAGRAFGEVPVIGNPTVGVTMLPGWPEFGAYTMAASVGIPIEVGGRRARYRSEAEIDIRAAEARVDAAVVAGVAEARMAYVELVTIHEEVSIQQARLTAARTIDERVHARVDAGAATAVERALTSRERAEAEADLAEAQRRRVEAESQLRRHLDLGANDALAVAPLTHPSRVEAGEQSQAAPRAQRQRRDVAALEQSAARFDASASRWQAASVAPLIVGLEGQQVAVSDNARASSLGASLRWELPLAQRNQGERALASAEASGQRVLATLLRRQIDREVMSSIAGLHAALDELEVLQRDALPAAERLVTATEASFSAGALDFFRVLTAQRDLLSVRSRILEATRRAWRARLEYERTTGAMP